MIRHLRGLRSDKKSPVNSKDCLAPYHRLMYAKKTSMLRGTPGARQQSLAVFYKAGGPMKHIVSSLAAIALVAGVSTKTYAMNCVAYARQVTGMNLSGDAWHWWYSADGVYDRGHRPVPGAVMVFSRTRHMIHGHVAVVRSILGPRKVLIDQANWWTGRNRGVVTEAVAAIDVSPNNDWTTVEVQYGRTNDFGRPNPISGFVYQRGSRPDAGMIDDAVLRRPADETDGFQEASFTVGARHAPRRQHAVFRHAAIRANCAHPHSAKHLAVHRVNAAHGKAFAHHNMQPHSLTHSSAPHAHAAHEGKAIVTHHKTIAAKLPGATKSPASKVKVQSAAISVAPAAHPARPPRTN